MDERVRVACTVCNVEFTYWPDPVHMDTPEIYWAGLFSALKRLADFWNERHDGPGFMVGLA